MSKVQVHKMAEDSISTLALSQEIAEMFEGVSKRAFELFQDRGSTLGRDLDDWFRAERDLVWTPPLDLIETETQFKLRLAASGYDASQIKVSALPDAIVVTAKAQHEARRQVGTVHIRELGSRRLFRRVELPSAIDIGQVTASLDDGVLRLVMGKSEPAGARRQAVSDRAAA